jgi:hypothetical protein
MHDRLWLSGKGHGVHGREPGHHTRASRRIFETPAHDTLGHGPVAAEGHTRLPVAEDLSIATLGDGFRRRPERALGGKGVEGR